MQLSLAITQLIFWAKPGNPRMERRSGGREAGREKGRGRQEAGMEGPERSLVTSYSYMDSASCILGWGSEFRVNMLDYESVVVTSTISSLQSCMF